MAPTLEQLMDLADELREAGFDIGTRRFVAAQELLRALDALGQTPAEPRGWRTLLAPIFCSSPEEQTIFYAHFDRWIERAPGVDAMAFDAAPPPIELSAPAMPKPGSARTHLPTVLIVAASGAGIVGGVLLGRWMLLGLIPLLLWLAWRIVHWWRRQAMLRRVAVTENPRLNRVRLKGAEKLLFQRPRFRRLAQELRRHRETAIRDLDVEETVEGTVRRGGLFAPRFRARRVSPEYLVLIDRAAPGDQQARFGEEMARRLEGAGVFIDRYYFQGDPLTCRLRDPLSPPVTLLELASRYPEHRLLVFSDGAGFLNPFTSEPEQWLRLLAHWPHRALLTPEPAAGYREAALAASGMRVLPANEDGLAGIAAVAARPRQPRPTAPFPRLIHERPRRWLERHEPRPELVAELIEQLRGWLDAGGWLWLRACAVYPALSWEITLYLGLHLLGDSDDFEPRLLSLVRLPWHRHGTMPDWLRTRLIDTFTPRQEQAVRQTLETMLSEIYDHGELRIEIAEPAPAAKQTRLQRWSATLAALRRRLRLTEDLHQEPRESPLRDAIFLDFLSGRNKNQLAVSLPDSLRRLLLREGQPRLRLRAMVMALATDAASELLRRFASPEVPESEAAAVASPPEASSIDAPFVGRVISSDRVDLGRGVTLELVGLSAGEFTMGGDRYDREKPRHRVRVSPFAIGKHQVTQAQWKAVMGEENNPSRFKGDDLPVERVSWDDAHEFIRRLNKKTGQRFRLPTEAEWEYAARGGSLTEFCFGDDEEQLAAYAWFGENSGLQTHPVGEKRPNPFGLFDVHGNVWEWCSDWFDRNYYGKLQKQVVVTDAQGPRTGSYRVIRGGSWSAHAVDCRSAYRYDWSPGYRYDHVGFRLVRIGP
ncbi:MAG: formylglycine-generating enzyme family protein [Blastocatellia bacterium]|nr:formylglycine-generating enzyme family protein [Blastocatellia bacterium]